MMRCKSRQVPQKKNSPAKAYKVFKFVGNVILNTKGIKTSYLLRLKLENSNFIY